MLNKFPLYLIAFLLWLPAPSRAETITLGLADGNEISAERFPATSKHSDSLFIWLPHEASTPPVDSQLAAQVAKLGIEIWLVDLITANFLPVAASSMDSIPPDQVSALITHASAKTGKKIYLVTSGRGAVPILRGARQWQLQNPSDKQLGGAILLSPKLFVETPDPGLEGELLPIASATNLPIYILQADHSPWFWKLPRVMAALEQGGSEVYVQRLDRVRDRFYFRPDAVADEQALTLKLPALIKQAAWLLQQLPNKPRPAVAQMATPPAAPAGKKDLRLQTFKGKPTPPPLLLKDLSGKTVDIKQLQGQVVLVNFWASWCPPCVHEMPSMARLMAHFKGQGFTILAVNMAEDTPTIQHFIDTKVKVNFPIVLDRDGAALRNWKVFAFPTSYLIDKKGKIRYAVFGSIDWDTPEILSTINTLLK